MMFFQLFEGKLRWCREALYIHGMLIQALLFFALSPAHAGVITGGGGGAFVCRDSNHAVISAELLDFWEAREISGLALIQDDVTSVDEQFARAAARLATIDSDLSDQAKKNYAFIFIKHNHVMGGPKVKIAPPNDANDRIFDANCQLEGMMFFDDQREKLVLKSEVFERLGSKTETAAAYFHEALYKAMRDDRLEGGKDSVLTRIIVGCLFAEGDLGACLNLKRIVPPTDRKVWRCEVPQIARDSGLSFIAYKENPEDEDWAIIPSRLGHTTFGYELHGVLRKVPVTLPGDAGPPGTGAFELDADAFRIAGLETLGLPWAVKTPPYGSTDFTIVATNPLSFQYGDSGKTYRCR